MRRLSLSNIRLYLLAFVVFGGAFALQPSISLAAFDFPTLRIGLYQIAAFLLIILSLPLIKRVGKLWFKNRWALVIVIVFLTTLVIGQIFSLVPQRTALYTLALLFLLIIAISSTLTFSSLTKLQKTLLVKIGLWSGIILGGLAILQLIIASFDPTVFGTLCRGCHSEVFGFPRINLFAAEPQFLASSLLPALFLAIFYRNTKPAIANWSILLSSIGIALTFSRGAFFAVAVALLTVIAITLIRKSPIKQLLKSASVLTIGVIIGFALLLASATARFHDSPNITYNTAVSMVDQLSLGVVDIPQKTIEAEPKTSTEKDQNDDFLPAGHIEASAEDRVSAADLALDAWRHSPKTILFGTGLGNLGKFIQTKLDHPAPTDQTVYIFYILLLSNIGLVGLIILLIPLLLAIFRTYKMLGSREGNFAFALLVAIAIQFWFFGSLINTIHCFAWIGIFLYNYPINHAKKL